MKHSLFITAALAASISFTSVCAQQQRTHLKPVTKADIPSQTDAKAKALLDKAAEKYKTDIKVDFKILVNDTKTGKKDNITGEIMMKGTKFRLSVPGTQTYYDGKYEYIYVAKDNEVSITVPTKKDLQEVNPAYLMTSYTTNSTIQFSMDNKSSDPNHIIDVYPDRSQGKGYYKATVKINKKTMELVSIKILSQNGVHTLFTVVKTQKNKYGDAFFTFYPKSHPGVVVNDLR